MSEFKRGWYLNSRETQEKLFDLGYKWICGGKKANHLTQKYVLTSGDGGLVCGRGDCHIQGVPQGTQLDLDDNNKKSNVDLFVDKLSKLLKQPEKWYYFQYPPQNIGPVLKLKFVNYSLSLDNLDFGLKLNDNQKVGLHELVLDLENIFIERENEKEAKILLDKISGVTDND